MNQNCEYIKKILEETFDIPFEVHGGMTFDEPWFKVVPENEMEELFEVNVSFRQKIRIIVEIVPQKYAKNMIHDMHSADTRKREIFLKYINLLSALGAKTEVFVNQESSDCFKDETWDMEWEKFRVRITKSPISEENEPFNGTLIAVEWLKSAVGMILSLLNVENIEEEMLFQEGGLNIVSVTRYERNPVNRELCLAANGYRCKICAFDFEEKYGDIGKKFIHVHHIEPVSLHPENYFINPETDLIPVCPNCHAMLHRKNPPYHPNELVKMICDQR